MNSRIRFYLKHTVSNLLRNRQRTIFVLFCIAAGVATIVSLRSVGLMIGVGLTENLQSDLKGDLLIQARSEDSAELRDLEIDPELITEGGDFQPTTFSDVGLERITAWGEERGYTVSPGRREPTPLQARRAVDPEGSETVSMIFIDTENYPFYGERVLSEPAGVSVRTVFNEPLDVVITDKLAAAIGVGIGDQMRLSGSRDPFTVRGLVPDTAEASLTDPSTLLFTFVYLNFTDGQERFNRTASEIRFQVPLGSDVREIESAFSDDFPGLRTRTTEDLREANETITSEITRLITTMGLVSLLIGGIGIINTMLVVVRRRALEIGVLKTIGVQGNEVTLMFMLEALILGILGSALGCALGLGLARLLQSVGERLAARTLTFAVFPEAIMIGMVAGTVITLVFGFMPTLAAGRVRPNIVLNPTGDNPIPSAGRWQSVGIVAVLTLIVGSLVGLILNDALLGIGGTIGTFIAVGLAGLLMWAVVVVFVKLPAFGSIRFKLSQRAMDSHKNRTASTLLALTIGMFALSIILMFTNSVLSLLQVSYSQEIGGNIVAFGQNEQANAALLETAESLDAISEIDYTETFQGTLVAINGDENIEDVIETARAIGFEQRLAEAEDLDPSDVEEYEERLDRIQTRVNFGIDFITDETTIQRIEEDLAYRVETGVDIAEGDIGKILMPTNDAVMWLGLDVGDTLTWEFENGERSTVEVAGLLQELDPRLILQLGPEANFATGAVISAESIPADADPAPQPMIISAEPSELQSVIDALSEVPDTFVFETSLIQSFVSNLLEQLTALPLAVAILSLFASAVIIANTVSLATLERRREIGIMKAIGLRGNQVLSLLLIENGILGLIGGVLGCSVGTALSVFVLLSDTTGAANFPFGTLLGLLALAVGIAVLATLITAVGAAREKPLIVLRYE